MPNYCSKKELRAELVISQANGELTDRFIELCYLIVEGSAQRYGRTLVLDDLKQDVLLIVIAKFQQIDTDRDVFNYLTTVAINAMRFTHRNQQSAAKLGTSSRFGEDGDEFDSVADTAEFSCETTDLIEHLRSLGFGCLLDAIIDPDNCHRTGNLNVGKVAESLGLSFVKVCEAIERLREYAQAFERPIAEREQQQPTPTFWHPSCKPLTINGVTHSISEWLKIRKLPERAYHLRLQKQGMSPEEAMMTPLRPHTHYATINGETKRVSEWCEIYGVARRTVRERVKAGMTNEEAIQCRHRDSKWITIGGETTYISDWLRRYGIPKWKYENLKRRGVPIEQAVRSLIEAQPKALPTQDGTPPDTTSV